MISHYKNSNKSKQRKKQGFLKEKSLIIIH